MLTKEEQIQKNKEKSLISQLGWACIEYLNERISKDEFIFIGRQLGFSMKELENK